MSQFINCYISHTIKQGNWLLLCLKRDLWLLSPDSSEEPPSCLYSVCPTWEEHRFVYIRILDLKIKDWQGYFGTYKAVCYSDSVYGLWYYIFFCVQPSVTNNHEAMKNHLTSLCFSFTIYTMEIIVLLIPHRDLVCVKRTCVHDQSCPSLWDPLRGKGLANSKPIASTTTIINIG